MSSSIAELMTAITDGNQAITNKTEELNSTLKSLQQKTRKEARGIGGLNRIDSDVDDLSTCLSQAEPAVNNLTTKVGDMENHSWRCNQARKTGLPEGLEGNRPTKFVEKLLESILGPDNFPMGIELQCTCALAPGITNSIPLVPG